MPPMANSSIAAVPADGKAVRIRLPTPIHKRAARRSCTPIKNAAVYAASRARIARLAHDRVHVDQKKVAQLPPLRTTLVAPDPEDTTSTILEPYRLWSFVLKKANNSWMWIALCRKTRQVVAYTVGDRSKKTCQRLWEAIPSEYRQGHCKTRLFESLCSCHP
jgi:IS1 transposase